MSVLTVIPLMGAGGAETVADALLRDQLHRGEAPLLATSGGFRLAPLADAGVTAVPVRLAGRAPRDLLGSVLALRRAVRRHRPEVVHAHNVKAGLVARLAVGRSVPVLTTVHGVPDREYALAARLLRRTSDRIVAVSTGVRERLLDAGLGTEVTVVENGVATPTLPRRRAARAALGLPEGSAVVLCLARLAPQKRHDLLLDAWARLAPSDALLVLAGDGPTRPAVERTVDALGLRSRVRLLGERTDVGALLAAADLAVLASDWEGLPVSLLEAMAAAVPVVATRVGDLDTSLGTAARLVPPGSAAALATALGGLLDDPAARARLGGAGRRLVLERYDEERMLRTYAEHLETLRFTGVLRRAIAGAAR